MIFLHFCLLISMHPWNFDLRILRLLRFIRFFRLFRLTAYTKSAQMIFNVFKSRFNELLLSFIMVIFLIIIASCLLFLLNIMNNLEAFSKHPCYYVVGCCYTYHYRLWRYGASYCTGKVLAGTIMLPVLHYLLFQLVSSQPAFWKK